MARYYTDTSCPLYGTKYCSALNMESCDKCPVDRETAKEVAEDIDAVFALLPEGGVYRFFSTDQCMLCKGEKKNKAQWYAMLDLGNPEPKKEKRTVLGVKTRAYAGSILPLQLSCCSECRKRHNAASGRRMAATVFTAIAVLGAVSIRPVGEALANVHMALPLLLVVACVLGAWVLSGISRKRLIKKYSDLTWFNVMEIPGVDELAKKNWFEMSPGKDVSRLIFAKEPLSRGLMTGPIEHEENI